MIMHYEIHTPNSFLLHRDGDTADDNFLISSLPQHKNLSVAIGGSAHGFKFLPIIGKYIVDMMEGNLDMDKASMWKWRPGARRTAINPFPMPLDDLNDCPEFETASRL
jgi:sarcosine oxidase / L-pipecolate oxidase